MGSDRGVRRTRLWKRSADLKGYFDSIPHSQLQACVRMRVVDRPVLRMIRMRLEAPVVEESDLKGRARKYLNLFPWKIAQQARRRRFPPHCPFGSTFNLGGSANTLSLRFLLNSAESVYIS